MTADALLKWLTSIGLEGHHDAFVAESVDIDIVSTLTDEDLRSFNLNLGERRRFLQAAQTVTSLEDTPVETSETDRQMERRNITVLFCDLVGSTALSNALEDESFARVVREYSRACGRAIERAGGRVAKYLGDGVMGYFGYPIATGDEAKRAIEAGFLIQQAVAAVDAHHESTVQARVGIASGIAIVGEVVGDQIDALGDTPNLAARVEANAEVGSVTVAPLTRKLAAHLFEFQDAGLHELKGFPEQVKLYRVTRPLDQIAAISDGTAERIVGRDAERAEIERIRRRASDRARVVRVEGEPGIGKSALLGKVIEDAREDDWRVFVLACSEHETSNPLHPLRRIIESATGIDLRSPDVDRLRALEHLADRVGEPEVLAVGRRLLALDADDDSTPAQARAEIFDLATALISGSLSAAPSMIVVEDLQWCDPTSFELLGEVIATFADAPLLVMVTERSGVAELEGQLSADAVIRLEAFEAPRARELIESITEFAVSDEIVSTICERSGGVPLYIAELTRTLLDMNAIVADSDSLTVGLDEVPDTLQDSLQARLDRLPNGRDVAPIAAAIGLDFSLALLAAAAPEGAKIDPAVRELQQSQLITTDGDKASFRHAMIRDVSYNRLLRDRRQSVHARIGTAIIEQFPDRAASEPQVVARHLSLGSSPVDSVEWWHEAAKKHARISAHQEVISDVGAGLAILDASPPSIAHDRAELQLQLLRAGTLRATQGFAADVVETVYERAVELSERTEDLDAMSAALNGTYSFNLVRDRYVKAGTIADQLLATAEASRDARRLVIAHRAVGVVAFHTADFARAQHHLRTSIDLYHQGDYREDAWLIGTDHATTAGSFLAMNELVSGLGDAMSTIDEAEAYATEIDHFFSWAQVMTYRGFMAVIARDWDGAQRAGDLLVERLADRTIPLIEASGRFWSAAGRFHQGDHGALADLRSAAHAWWDTGAHSYASYLRCVIAEAEGIVGRPRDGLETIASSFSIIAENNEHWALAECHRVAAGLHASADEPAEAAAEMAMARQIAEQQSATFWLERLSSPS